MEGGQPWDVEELPPMAIDRDGSFEGFLDLKWNALTAETASVQFTIRENLLQPWGLLHGGIYSAVAETVASVATTAAVWRDGMVAAGLSNSASFLRPAVSGRVDVQARLVGSDDRSWLWNHEFRDDAGRLCALVDVTIAVRPAPAKAA